MGMESAEIKRSTKLPTGLKEKKYSTISRYASPFRKLKREVSFKGLARAKSAISEKEKEFKKLDRRKERLDNQKLLLDVIGKAVGRKTKLVHLDKLKKGETAGIFLAKSLGANIFETELEDRIFKKGEKGELYVDPKAIPKFQEEFISELEKLNPKHEKALKENIELVDSFNSIKEEHRKGIDGILFKLNKLLLNMSMDDGVEIDNKYRNFHGKISDFIGDISRYHDLNALRVKHTPLFEKLKKMGDLLAESGKDIETASEVQPSFRSLEKLPKKSEEEQTVDLTRVLITKDRKKTQALNLLMNAVADSVLEQCKNDPQILSKIGGGLSVPLGKDIDLDDLLTNKTPKRIRYNLSGALTNYFISLPNKQLRKGTYDLEKFVKTLAKEGDIIKALETIDGYVKPKEGGETEPEAKRVRTTFLPTNKERIKLRELEEEVEKGYKDPLEGTVFSAFDEKGKKTWYGQRRKIENLETEKLIKGIQLLHEMGYVFPGGGALKKIEGSSNQTEQGGVEAKLGAMDMKVIEAGLGALRLFLESQKGIGKKIISKKLSEEERKGLEAGKKRIDVEIETEIGGLGLKHGLIKGYLEKLKGGETVLQFLESVMGADSEKLKQIKKAFESGRGEIPEFRDVKKKIDPESLRVIFGDPEKDYPKIKQGHLKIKAKLGEYEKGAVVGLEDALWEIAKEHNVPQEEFGDAWRNNSLNTIQKFFEHLGIFKPMTFEEYKKTDEFKKKYLPEVPGEVPKVKKPAFEAEGPKKVSSEPKSEILPSGVEMPELVEKLKEITKRPGFGHLKNLSPFEILDGLRKMAEGARGETAHEAAEFVSKLKNPHEVHVLLEQMIEEDETIKPEVKRGIIDLFKTAHEQRKIKSMKSRKEGYQYDVATIYRNLMRNFFNHDELRNKPYINEFFDKSRLFEGMDRKDRESLIEKSAVSLASSTIGKRGKVNKTGSRVHMSFLNKFMEKIKA